MSSCHKNGADALPTIMMAMLLAVQQIIVFEELNYSRSDRPHKYFIDVRGK